MKRANCYKFWILSSMSAALGWGLGGFLPFDRLSMAGVAWAVEDSVGEDSILLTPKNRSIDPRQLKDSACVFPSTQTNSSSPASPCLSDTAQTLPSLQPATRGVRVQTNDRPWPVAWRQLPAGTEARVEISDTGLMQIAGVELLDTEDFTQQPVRWFDSEPMILTATIADGYRYLDITEFARQVGWEWIVQGETLYITSPTARVENIQTAVRDWGDQIAIELDTATPWQLDRTENGWVVLLDAAIPQRLVDRFRPRSDKNPQHKPLADESELPPFAIDTDGQQTRIHLKTSASVPPRIYSRSDAPELVIEMRPDSLMPRNLVWAPGIRWRQAMFDGEEAKFPVFWLEVDLRNPQVTLDPIWTQPDTQVGIAPLWQIAPLWGATAAINGGYFNRDRQLALGGIRRDGRWFSSPILDRGAIAWNDAGEARIARLTLEEMLLTSSGDRIPISTLNSGYVGAGVSRYTPEWGATYTPILNNEAIAIVYNRRIIEIQAGGKAGSRSVPIPPNGYILTIRDDPAALDRLTIGMELDTEQILDPPEFADYPDILAAGPVLMRDGQIVLDAEAERFNENFREGAAARSAIATTEAGTLLLVTIQNGTQGVGPTLEETAQIVRQLGAVDALNLDGGGSASLALGGQLVNRSPRNVSRVHNGLGVFLNFAP